MYGRPDWASVLTDQAYEPEASGGRPRSLRLFLVLGCLTMIGPASFNIYLPGLPELASDFGASTSSAQMTLTTFLLGMAFGQLLAGSLSDVHGRRRPLIGGMILFAIASLVCALAPNLYVLATVRFVQGATAAAGMAIGRAIVRDLYTGAAAAHYLSRLILIVGIAPVLAPVLGGQLLRFTSWRGIFVALTFFGLALALVAARLLPETLAHTDRRDPGLSATARTFRFLLGDRRFVGFVLVVSFANGAILAYLAGSSFVLEDIYGVSAQFYGVLFGINALFMVLGAQVNAHLLLRRSPHRLLGFGLVIALVAAAVLLVVVPFPGAGVALISLPFALLWFSWSFVQSNALALALTDHPSVAGTAAALLGVSQFLLGGLIAPLVGAGGSDTVWPMALIIAICTIGAALAFRALVPATSPQTPECPSGDASTIRPRAPALGERR